MKKKNFKGSTMLSPVPVVLVATRNRKGEQNVFTVAWTGIISSTPPMLYISVRPERLSYTYLKDTMEFSINLPSKSMIKELDFCGVKSGRQTDKIKECHFTMKKGEKIKAGYIDECPINLECKVKEVKTLGGSHDMFIADIVSVHVAESIIDDNQKIHFDWADLIAFSHGEYFQLNQKRLGSFGYSVAKNKTIIRKSKEIKKKPTSLKISGTKRTTGKFSKDKKATTRSSSLKNVSKSKTTPKKINK